ncbi:uncharacterized protein G2W53_004266 [Senna tora]|uniref:Uncharacterized protein n=1 Tax=Senna tora TaxID=362788 RepID=A0A834XCK0_9FABA|nr:uncharacterized protein G2W53_004266 [Senna tora]
MLLTIWGCSLNQILSLSVLNRVGSYADHHFILKSRAKKFGYGDAKKLRKESKAAKQALKASSSAEQLEILYDLSTLFAEGKPFSENMAVENTLREHAALSINQAPLCIATPTLQSSLELKSGLIHLLPKFRGLINEDPY